MLTIRFNRFDCFQTLISYVQSRGRARHEDSKYIILMEKGDVAAERLLYELRQSEHVVRDWCNGLPADRKASVQLLDDDPYNLYSGNEDDDYEDDVDDFFLVPSTQAAITLNSAVSLIHHYCSTLPKDEYCDLKPEFICVNELDTFICTLKLPSNAVVQQTFTEVARSKGLAKKLVAMKAAIAIYHSRGLSDHLMPIVVKPEMLGDMAPQMDRKGNIIGSRKRRKVYKKKVPWFWEKRVPKALVEEEVFDEDERYLNMVLSSQQKWLSMDDTSVPLAIKANENHNSGENNASETSGQITPGEKTGPISAPTLENSGTDANLVAQVQSQDQVAEVLEEEDTNKGPITLYLTHIKHNLNDDLNAGVQYRDICILTHKELPIIPPFHLYLQNRATETIVRTVSIGQGYTFDLEEAEMLRKYTIQIFSAISNKSYECDLDEMAYFLVPLKFDIHDKIGRDSFDWSEIGRVVESQTSKMDLENLDQYIDRVVVDQSDSFRRYIFHQARQDMTPASEFQPGYHGREVGYKNFADYYEQVFSRVPENMDQPMIEVRRFTKVLNYLSPIVNVEAKAPRRSAQYLIPEFCHIYPVSTSMYRTAMLMPSVMMHIDAVLLVKEVNEKLETSIDETLLLEAFTTPSANVDVDYERLETLGDSFLKFVATIRLYIMFPQSHEGQLHCQRIRIICNKALYRGARRLQLYKHITSQPFNRRRWRPPHFKLSTDNKEDLRMKLRRHELSDKTLADIVEATMGAAYLAGGVELGLKSAIALQIPFDHMTEWKHFNETYTESHAQLKPRVKEASRRHLKLDHLEEITGYRFRNPLLVVEALTHASEPNSTVPCYQRLEFLGDGILDFLVVNYLFHKYTDYEPGRMTDIKDGCVNNRVLGTMCLEIGLNKHIIHFSSKLMGAITQFAREVELIKDSGENVGEYWSDLDVPKVLSDVVESVLGAIFVDSGFDFEAVQKSFNFFMLPFFDKYVQPDILKVHPLKTLTTGLQKIHCDGLLLR
jgi:dsRNA-specific ribonuclease